MKGSYLCKSQPIIVIEKDYESMSHVAAFEIVKNLAKIIRLKGQAIWVPSTGGTPSPAMPPRSTTATIEMPRPTPTEVAPQISREPPPPSPAS